MPTGVLHLKEVDTDEITLDGTLSVSGASTLEGATVTHSTLSVGGAATLADANATNVNVSGTLSVAGQTTMGGDIIPDTNDAYDIGSPEFKIRDLYVSNNSIWVGDDMKISNVNGSLKFRKRKTDVVPKAIIDAGANAGHANEQATASAALAHAGVDNVSDMKLQHWFKFMRTLNQFAKLTDIFRDTDDDYEETSASDAWKEISDTNKIYTNSAVGVGTSDPDDTLHVKGSFKVESETGFKLIRSSVGGTDPTVIIDTQNFGTDETVNDITGMECNKYTKLYRVYGRNSEGVGRSWYWGYANDDYSNFSLAFDGGGLPDPDIAFTFTTASELHCNKVYAALGGNADTATLAAEATKLATPRKINGVDFDGTQDITINNVGGGSTAGISSDGTNITVAGGLTVNDNIQFNSANGAGADGKFAMYSWDDVLELNPRNDSGGYDNITSFTMNGNGLVGFGTREPSAQVTVAHDMGSTNNTIPASNMGMNTAFPKGTHLWLANAHSNYKPYWGLAIGTTWAGDSYLQNLNKTTNVYYNLLLQPNGGFVGVGTNNPETKFSVVGNAWDNSMGGVVLISSSHTVGSSITFNPTASAKSSPRWSIVANGPGGGAADGNIGFFDHNARDYPVVIYKGAGLVNPNAQATTTNNIKLRVKGSIYMPNNADGIIIGGATSTVLKDEMLKFGWGGGWYATESSYIKSFGRVYAPNELKLRWQHSNGTLGDSYAFHADNDGWLRLKGEASGQGNMSGIYASMAVGNCWVDGELRVKGQMRPADAELIICNIDNQLGFKYPPGHQHQDYSYGKYNGPHHYDVYGAPYYMNYYSNSDVFINNTAYSSDDRVKTNERYITDATATLIKLKPQIYTKGPNLGSESGISRTESGLIAQDVYYDTPELRHLVTYHDDAKIPDEKPYVDNDPTKDPDYSMWGSKTAGVDYIGLIAYLVQSVKENEEDKKALTALVESKDVEIENLKKELNDEKMRMNDVISRIELLEEK